MKQVENYKSKCIHSHLDTRDLPDSCWRHTQKRSQSFPISKISKNPESTTNYYSSSTSYKPQKSHVCSSLTYPKNTSVHSTDAPHIRTHSKPNRDKHSSSYSSKFSSKGKTHYDDELGDIDKLKFTDEGLGNLIEGHIVEDVEEELTEDDREVPAEFLDKDYEEQEADDEIDDESDGSPQTHRSPRGGKTEALLRQQRWGSVEQQPDTRKLRYQQHVAMIHNHPSSPRYYRNVAEHEVPEPLSEEDFVRTSLKSPPRRQPANYRQWSSSRNEHDRYDDATTLIHTTRRARTKPDVDRLIESELNRTKRCNRCGNLSSKKNEPPLKNSCRFDDCANIPIKGPIGDESENHEQTFCGRCNVRYNSKDPCGATDIPSPLYTMKSRRSREVKSPTIYEVPEQSQDKLPTDYPRSLSRYQRKLTDAYTERLKRSLHTSHGTARTSFRHVE
ncbi:uncharacterized protein LOC100748781 [Bombus impatiens]|uniref:Uncharacterized protein LOC100748781 n=1 Tax=Bombus impatiens TaxID=132113 RepID=A0A6P6FFN7_BOMIM|nr:uncharacterized protein LOC100748781 [Bombus impatiens]